MQRNNWRDDWRDLKVITRGMAQCLRPRLDREVVNVVVVLFVCFFAVMVIVAANTRPAEAAMQTPTAVATAAPKRIYPCKGCTTGTAVRFREEPNTSSKIWEEMRWGSTMTVFGEEDGWYYVCRNDLYGYVKAEYVELIFD